MKLSRPCGGGGGQDCRRQPLFGRGGTNKSIFILILALVCLIVSHQSELIESLDIMGDHHDGPPVAADRIKDEQESVWVEFSQLANKYKPLNMGQGFPDFPSPHFIIDSLNDATNLTNSTNWTNNQYTRSFGHPRLVKALVDYYHGFRSFEKLRDPNNQVLITVGAHEAIFASMMAFVNPNDEVLILDPAYDAYAASVRLAQGRPVFVPLRPKGPSSASSSASRPEINGTSSIYRLDLEEFESKITKRSKILVLNTPNNPLGKVFTRPELEAIAAICIKHNLLVVADEVYEHIYYSTGEPHVSIATLPGMWERTMTIGSAGKTFSVTGWKIGWIFGPQELIKYVQFVHQSAVLQVATPLQEATARAFEHEMDLSRANRTAVGYWEQELRLNLLLKRNRMAGILARAGMEPILPQGGYFMVADFSRLAERFPEYKQVGLGAGDGAINRNDFRFARWLSQSKKLQGIPVSAFYSDANKHLADNLVRFCFIKQDETLNRMETLLNGLGSSKPDELRNDDDSESLPRAKL